MAIKRKIKRGRLLIAEPFALDPNFRRSVVLICDHHLDGSMGFILNKPLDMKINELIADFPDLDASVYYGGPVKTDTIHYIHRKGDLLDDAKDLGKGLYWGGDFEKLKKLIELGLITSSDIRFFVGYSGWSEGQLQEEMEYNSWVVSEVELNYIFKSKPSQLWQNAMADIGSTFSVIAQMPENSIAN